MVKLLSMQNGTSLKTFPNTFRGHFGVAALKYVGKESAGLLLSIADFIPSFPDTFRLAPSPPE